MSHISLRLDDDLEERLDRYAERHHLENRSQALRHALRSILNLEEGESVALRPAHSPARKSMKSVSKRPMKKGAPLAVVRDTAHDRLEGQKVIDRVTKARTQKRARPEPEPVQEEDEAEYFARIQRENEQKAKGPGPEEWS